MDWEQTRLQQRMQIRPDQVEAVYALIAEIDSTKLSWQIASQLVPGRLSDMVDDVIAISAAADERMLNKRGQAAADQYADVLRHVFESHDTLKIEVDLLKKIHLDLQAGSTVSGQFKRQKNLVNRKDKDGNILFCVFRPTPPDQVEAELNHLFNWYHWAIQSGKKHHLIIIANFLFELLAIHPFFDGNGRVSRVLTNLLLLQSGYGFTSIISHEKIVHAHIGQYYRALMDTQKTWKTDDEDITPWLLYFLQVVRQQAVEAIHQVIAHLKSA